MENDNPLNTSPYKVEDVFGGYLLQEKLGRITFKARRESDQKIVAIKIFHKSLESGQQMYETEAKAFQLTKDIPGVLHPLDEGKFNEDFYIATEFVSKETLRDELNRHPSGMNIEDVIHIFKPIADTIDQLHKHNIIHRDLKPENVLLQKAEDTYKTFITDFGVVKFSNTYRTGTTAGTNWYIAPEAWEANPKISQTKAVDTYSIGVMLYEALEGRVPFRDISDILTKPIATPVRVLQKTDETTVNYIVRSLSKDPAERPESATEIMSGLHNAYQSKLSLKNKWIGRRFKNYEIEETLPKGMNSISFRAKDMTTENMVVLKMFGPEYSFGNELSEHQKAFETEIAILQKLESGHGVIVPKEQFEQNGLYFIVSNYKDGGNFRDLLPGIQNETIDIDKALDLIMQIARAIDYIHSAHIVHRDIKPDNIVFSDNSGEITLFLTDFGISKVLTTTQVSFATHLVSGTYRYMAPEQWNPDVHKTKAVDLYSFGIMVYEAFEGRAPFNADMPALITQHLYHNAPEPVNIKKNFGPDSVKIIEKILSKDPSLRYTSAVEFVNELKNARQTFITQKGFFGSGLFRSQSTSNKGIMNVIAYWPLLLVTTIVLFLFRANTAKSLFLSPPATASYTTAVSTLAFTATSTFTVTSTKSTTFEPLYTPVVAILNKGSYCYFRPNSTIVVGWLRQAESVIILGKNNDKGEWLKIRWDSSFETSKECWIVVTAFNLKVEQLDSIPVESTSTASVFVPSFTSTARHNDDSPTPKPPTPTNTPKPPDPTNTPKPPDPTNTPKPPDLTNTPCKNPKNPNKCPNPTATP